MENLETSESYTVTESENQESDNEFIFETDHLALRGNKDYCNLLKYIVQLEAQKVQALKDIEEVAEVKIKALDDPLEFVKNLHTYNFPPRQTVPDLPEICLSKYGIDMSIKNEDDDLRDSKVKDEEDLTKVRGRKFTDSKPETFNQLWSYEEQKRLEELLEIYPEEPVEARRYKKIAKALGTRTPLQVTSRIQKYFAKLSKAGLPIPGRAPKKLWKTRNKMPLVCSRKTTFFPQLHVPVQMEDQVDNDLNDSPTYAEHKDNNAYILDILRMAKEQRLIDETSPVYQTRTMCVGCKKTGFLGARWTDNAGTDYCTDCIVKLLPTEKLIPTRQPI